MWIWARTKKILNTEELIDLSFKILELSKDKDCMIEVADSIIPEDCIYDYERGIYLNNVKGYLLYDDFKIRVCEISDESLPAYVCITNTMFTSDIKYREWYTKRVIEILNKRFPKNEIKVIKDTISIHISTITNNNVYCVLEISYEGRLTHVKFFNMYQSNNK